MSEFGSPVASPGRSGRGRPPRSPSPLERRRSQSPMAVTPGMAAERREGRMNGGVPFYSPPGRSWQQRGSTFDDRNFAVVGLDDDEARSSLDHSLLKQWQEADVLFAGGKMDPRVLSTHAAKIPLQRADPRFAAAEAMPGKWNGRHLFNACGKTKLVGGIKVTALLALAAASDAQAGLRALLQLPVDEEPPNDLYDTDDLLIYVEENEEEEEREGGGDGEEGGGDEEVALPASNARLRRCRARRMMQREEGTVDVVRAAFVVRDSLAMSATPREEHDLGREWYGRHVRRVRGGEHDEDFNLAVKRAAEEEKRRLLNKGIYHEGLKISHTAGGYVSGKKFRFSDLEALPSSENKVKQKAWLGTDRGLQLDRDLSKRWAIKDHAAFEAAVKAFFDAAVDFWGRHDTRSPVPGPNPAGEHKASFCKEEYLGFASAAFRCLVPEEGRLGAEQAEHIWRCDRGRSRDSIDFDRFHDILFDLADAWVVGTNLRHYVTFVEVLMFATFDTDLGFLSEPRALSSIADEIFAAQRELEEKGKEEKEKEAAASRSPSPPTSRVLPFSMDPASTGHNPKARFVEISHVGSLEPARHDRFVPRFQHLASGGFAQLRVAMQAKADAVMARRHAGPGGGLFAKRRPSTAPTPYENAGAWGLSTGSSFGHPRRGAIEDASLRISADLLSPSTTRSLSPTHRPSLVLHGREEFQGRLLATVGGRDAGRAHAKWTARPATSPRLHRASSASILGPRGPQKLPVSSALPQRHAHGAYGMLLLRPKELEPKGKKTEDRRPKTAEQFSHHGRPSRVDFKTGVQAGRYAPGADVPWMPHKPGFGAKQPGLTPAERHARLGHSARATPGTGLMRGKVGDDRVLTGFTEFREAKADYDKGGGLRNDGREYGHVPGAWATPIQVAHV